MNTVLQLSVVTLALIVPVVQAGPILDQTLLALWLVSLATELGKVMFSPSEISFPMTEMRSFQRGNRRDYCMVWATVCHWKGLQTGLRSVPMSREIG